MKRQSLILIVIAFALVALLTLPALAQAEAPVTIQTQYAWASVSADSVTYRAAGMDRDTTVSRDIVASTLRAGHGTPSAWPIKDLEDIAVVYRAEHGDLPALPPLQSAASMAAADTLLATIEELRGAVTVAADTISTLRADRADLTAENAEQVETIASQSDTIEQQAETIAALQAQLDDMGGLPQELAVCLDENVTLTAAVADLTQQSITANDNANAALLTLRNAITPAGARSVE